MAIELYYTAASPPCRLVLLVAASLNVPLNLHNVDLQAGDQFKPDFLTMNPQHTVPTINDDGFVLWESRAIARYLVNAYGKSSALYPEDPKARALVDQRLDFDMGTLYSSFSKYFYPQLFGGKPDPDQLKKVEESLYLLNMFLTKYKFVAGDELTIADLALVATVSTIDAADISLKPYLNIKRWFDLVKKTAPGYKEANERGVEEFKKFVAMLKAKTEL